MSRERLDAALGILGEMDLEGEVYYEDGRRLKAVVSGGETESLEERKERGLGIRVFDDGRVGFSFTTDLSIDAIRQAAGLAAQIARHAGRDPAWRLPATAEAAPLAFPNESAEAEVSASRWIDTAAAAERAALSADPRVRRTRQAACTEARGEVHVAHTGGLVAGYRYSRAVVSVDLTATENESSQTGFHVEFALGAGQLDPVAVGTEAAARALAKLGARPANTGRVAAVLDREVVAGLLDALSAAFSARRVLKGTSLLRDRIGERVASQTVSVVDDPRLPGGYGSAPVDGEGQPTERVVLIEEGRLRGYLHDTFSAGRMGMGAPGSAARDSYSAPPRISPANLLLLPGEAPSEALVERAGRGVWISEVMGLHTVDPVTGDFSLGASGRLIRAGRLGDPVERIALSGNLLDLLSAVVAVGSDLKLFPGGGGAPSVLVSELSIAGQ